ncbi:cytochrome c oxidase subunit 3 [Pseudomonas fluorescens]|uniref:cytochrome c oxidase subunit 3 n=1 Tax=Pseudomonas fluorescens TaxID=294 RepID=UPI00177E1719|nr:cytochrome c oxidase subunit 3 [Pseudomonas fluorescens]
MSTSLETVATRRLPGDLAMWLFILAELSVFALLILAFAVTQALKPQLFAASRQLLDTSTGLAMTLSLLSAGLLAALAQQRVRQAQPGQAALLSLLALLVACGYLGLKLGEYRHLLSLGLGLEHNTFFTLYWILTGFHFLHVLLGMLILAWLAEGCRRRRYGPGNCSGFESGVLYWHMVDLVWVVLFPLVYLLG